MSSTKHVLQQLDTMTSNGFLDLQRAGLHEVPDLIFTHKRAADITVLELSGNRLTLLPEDRFKKLTSLRELRLNINHLRTFPQEALAGCKNLETLSLNKNSIRVLEVGDAALPCLRQLYARMNGIEEVDESISNLSSLEILDLSGNLLKTIHWDLSRLSKLKELHLGGNPEFAPGDEISQLQNLQLLDLSNNNLLWLPRGLGYLTKDVALAIEGNFLSEHIEALASRGSKYLMAYLRTAANELYYQAKLIVVGEGNIGKTSMIEALRGNSFVENRDTTHGIEIKTFWVDLPPELIEAARDRVNMHDRVYRNGAITIRSWDFGGQEIYRVTHQFYFSQNALYIVAWRPREGQEENAVANWINRIKIRCADNARVLIVATYGEERQPEIDYSGLRQKFGHLLAGNHRIDSKSGKGIPELKQLLGGMAAGLPRIGEPISASWLRVQDELLSISAPNTTRAHYDRICERHGVDEIEGEALAGFLNDLGYIVYYPDDQDLRNFLILQPEWLTKAISYVLEDKITRANSGILDHDRLDEIWGNERHGYGRALYPYFLRLMEKFDVSYRVSGDDTSLIAQLVPSDRQDSYVPSGDELRMYCDFSTEPTGLIPWLTVRTRRFSVMKHWRKGFYLEHPEYDAKALIEAVSTTRLFVRVSGGSRSFLFDIIRDTLEQLIRSRWPGLKYRLRVPCAGGAGVVGQCEGSFPISSLELMRSRGQAKIQCTECVNELEVNQLLVGFSAISAFGSEMTDAVEMRQIGASLYALLLFAKAANSEVTDCPRLFTLRNAEPRFFDVRRAFSRTYLLDLWCEEPGSHHPVGDPYNIRASREWFVEIAPYMRIVSRAVTLLAPMAGGVAAIFGEAGLKDSANLMKSLADAASPPEFSDSPDPTEGHTLSPAEGAALRRFRELLLKIDNSRQFRGLRRAFAPTGEWVWLCPEHYREYEPPLPRLPGSKLALDLGGQIEQRGESGL